MSAAIFLLTNGACSLLTFKHSDRSRVIIHSPRGFQGGCNDGGRGHEIVGEGIVEVALELEDVLDLVELFFVSTKDYSLIYARYTSILQGRRA